eukprot:SAG25_NODE_5193_length_691_cov_0.614865_1_plen_161_part_00
MAACSSKGQWRAFLRDLLVERGLSLTNREAWTALNTKFGVDVCSGDRQWVRDMLKELVEELGLHSGVDEAKKSSAGHVDRAKHGPPTPSQTALVRRPQSQHGLFKPRVSPSFPPCINSKPRTLTASVPCMYVCIVCTPCIGKIHRICTKYAESWEVDFFN